MALSKGETAAIVGQYATKSGDTGSSAVQIALLTQRINSLNEHLKTHKHDQGSRYGLLKMVGQRRRHLKYLAANDATSYKALLARLGLRK